MVNYLLTERERDLLFKMCIVPKTKQVNSAQKKSRNTEYCMLVEYCNRVSGHA